MLSKDFLTLPENFSKLQVLKNFRVGNRQLPIKLSSVAKWCNKTSFAHMFCSSRLSTSLCPLQNDVCPDADIWLNCSQVVTGTGACYDELVADKCCITCYQEWRGDLPENCRYGDRVSHLLLQIWWWRRAKAWYVDLPWKLGKQAFMPWLLLLCMKCPLPPLTPHGILNVDIASASPSERPAAYYPLLVLTSYFYNT